MIEPADGPVQIGLVVSHPLVARYLQDLLIKLNLDHCPAILSDRVTDQVPLPAGRQVVIVFDLHGLLLPVNTYLETFSKLKDSYSFLALDLPRKSSDIARLLLAGFSGFVTHDEVPHALGPAIDSIAKGLIWAPAEVMRLYMKLTSRRTPPSIEALTKREDQILELLRRRYSNREMAVFLGISESTIKFHVSNVMAKLNVRGRRDLTEDTLQNRAH